MKDKIQFERIDNFTKLDTESSELAASLYKTELLKQEQEEQEAISSIQACSSSTKSNVSSHSSFTESPTSTRAPEPYDFETLSEDRLGDVKLIQPVSKPTEETNRISATRRNASTKLQSPSASPVPPSDGSPVAQGGLHRSLSARFMSMAADVFIPRSQSSRL